MKKQNKKGFTLAELLIVVAIIAVLTAIAVPIFVGALNKAEQATIDANERTLKGMVAAEILSDDTLLYYTKTGEASKPCDKWYAMGTYDAATDTWAIEKSKIIKNKKDADGTEVENPYAKFTSSKSGKVYTLYVTINYADINRGE